ncbi:undecaprenyldiphospho-muramoylpentapeptide beta-N-acetylglucosaminyltransferase [Chryseomicrobium palamuruense]|uniref:UDP-N-acetylglucosamine--N-acetylmuramyl-(pentapeptide) pyrophosphoryl-undecaprenol N-acetylglucosamine transferase n=1 Tax=Chryseomicrobium palamuruense TaxID=682973 RepID=A0ABV8UV95_9BACL
MKTIFLTGGGTAGHVSLNLAIIPELEQRGYAIHYVGQAGGIEEELMQGYYPHIPFHSISTGKLRRYFSLQNAKDPFKVLAGVAQSIALIRKHKADAIFSKGGFVSVPLALAAKLTNRPLIIHESDMSPGLANKIASKFANTILTVFESTAKHFPGKGVVVGPLIRPELFKGSAEKARTQLGFSNNLPILLVMGGSQGSAKINQLIRETRSELLSDFQLIHLAGKGHIHGDEGAHPGYRIFEFVTDELPDYLAASDYIISRAGSNAIFEFLALKKPMYLIPLSKKVSRGDQVENAHYFASKGFAVTTEEDMLTTTDFMEAIHQMVRDRKQMIQSQTDAQQPPLPQQFVDLLEMHWQK